MFRCGWILWRSIVRKGDNAKIELYYLACSLADDGSAWDMVDLQESRNKRHQREIKNTRVGYGEHGERGKWMKVVDIWGAKLQVAGARIQACQWRGGSVGSVEGSVE